MAITSPKIPGPSPKGGKQVAIPNTGPDYRKGMPKLVPPKVFTPHIGLKLGTG